MAAKNLEIVPSTLLWTCLGLTHWGREKMDAISQTTCSSAFFLNENVWIPIEISLKFVPKGSINNNPALFQIMAWRRPGDKPLSEPMLVCLLTYICVTRPQWVHIIKLSAILLLRFSSVLSDDTIIYLSYQWLWSRILVLLIIWSNVYA